MINRFNELSEKIYDLDEDDEKYLETLIECMSLTDSDQFLDPPIQALTML